jgi:uncharacterized protein YjiS (DUF1127 family)
MLTTVRSYVRAAADHMKRRHACDLLAGASDHMLRDIGVTRDGLYWAVVRNQR